MTVDKSRPVVRTNLARYLKANSNKRNRKSFTYKVPYATFSVWPIQGRGSDWRIRLEESEEKNLLEDDA